VVFVPMSMQAQTMGAAASCRGDVVMISG
jgi:hypothetical protein